MVNYGTVPADQSWGRKLCSAGKANCLGWVQHMHKGLSFQKGGLHWQLPQPVPCHPGHLRSPVFD